MNVSSAGVPGVEPQREVLSPGDELFVPAGTVYNVVAQNEADCRFMFALCVNNMLGMEAGGPPETLWRPEGIPSVWM